MRFCGNFNGERRKVTRFLSFSTTAAELVEECKSVEENMRWLFASQPSCFQLHNRWYAVWHGNLRAKVQSQKLCRDRRLRRSEFHHKGFRPDQRSFARRNRHRHCYCCSQTYRRRETRHPRNWLSATIRKQLRSRYPVSPLCPDRGSGHPRSASSRITFPSPT